VRFSLGESTTADEIETVLSVLPEELSAARAGAPYAHA
jgi:hypothetical protein